MGTICKITASGGTHLIASTAFGYCYTGRSVANKTASLLNGTPFTLVAGTTVHIYMENENSEQGATLNVDSTGAKPIRRGGNSPYNLYQDTTSWLKGSVVSFTYDGTYWCISGEVNDVDTMTYVVGTRLPQFESYIVNLQNSVSSLNSRTSTVENGVSSLTSTTNNLSTQVSNVSTKYIEYKNNGLSVETTQLDHGVLVKKYISFTPDSTGHGTHDMPVTFIPIGFALDSTVVLLQNKPVRQVTVGKKSGYTNLTTVDLWAHTPNGTPISGETISGWLYGIQ